MSGFFSGRRSPFWRLVRALVDVARMLGGWYRGLVYYLVNHLVAAVPFYFVRHSIYRLLGIKIGVGSSIKLHAYVEAPGKGPPKIEIGNHSTIGRHSLLDGRGRLAIGSNVSISPHVQMITASHRIDRPDFEPSIADVVIEDYVWIGTRATILPGVTIGRGAVVGAGAVVVAVVNPMEIVAGVPAKVIGQRSVNPEYRLSWKPPFE